MENNLPAPDLHHIAIIGAGTIGLSIAALHVPFKNTITIYDTRSDLEEYVHINLPPLLGSSTPFPIHVKITANLEEAVKDADIVQESCPEILALKQDLWPRIETACPLSALLWSSTSGIPASAQSQQMKDPSRLIIVHPYNPPHIMPLLEVVPGPETPVNLVDETLRFWRERGRRPVLVKKEAVGFVANRLAFALLREAIHLVASDVVSVKDLDAVVEASMGPRWAVAGPLKSYAAGGGEMGLEGFFDKIGRTVQDCWDDQGSVEVGGEWQQDVFRKAYEAYGTFGKTDAEERNSVTMEVLEAVRIGRLNAEKRCKELKELEKALENENLD
ncbi:MAG: hypothetical protein M1821_009557 [Bathelium mastoideum]|nr:MAG: hypothetical protein M1821_009557 [Bathelium mastoideum]KAI9688780.1 MAG: hypothetical protein M1822_001137 [Bathelium mastoideum]